MIMQQNTQKLLTNLLLGAIFTSAALGVGHIQKNNKISKKITEKLNDAGYSSVILNPAKHSICSTKAYDISRTFLAVSDIGNRKVKGDLCFNTETNTVWIPSITPAK